MTERHTVLITGGTGSLGYQTAKVLAGTVDLVVITGRDGAEAARRAASIGDNVVGLALDLGSLADVRRFASTLLERELPPLGAIVCNAAVQNVSGTRWTSDGVEQTFGVNHLAHFLLVQELLPHLARPGRVVLVASDTHDPARHTGMPAPEYTDARSLAYPASGPEPASLVGRRRYTTSKLCNVMTAYELARRLDDPAVAVHAFDPGLMPGTGLARDYGQLQAFAWKYLLPVLTVLPGLNAHTPRRSAAALARLVLDPALAHPTGRYFSGTRELRSSRDSYDLAAAAELWDTSLELTAQLPE